MLRGRCAYGIRGGEQGQLLQFRFRCRRERPVGVGTGTRVAPQPVAEAESADRQPHYEALPDLRAHRRPWPIWSANSTRSDGRVSMTAASAYSRLTVSITPIPA